MPIRHSKHVDSQAHEDDRNRYPVDALSQGHPTARCFHNAYFYYTTSGWFIGMRSQPNSVTCKQFIINRNSTQYTTAGSFIEGPKSPCDGYGNGLLLAARLAQSVEAIPFCLGRLEEFIM